MRVYLSAGELWRAISMRLDQCMTKSRIANIINCSTQTISNILNLFTETNDVLERTERGGSNSLTIEKRHVLRQLFYRYPNETFYELMIDFAAE